MILQESKLKISIAIVGLFTLLGLQIDRLTASVVFVVSVPKPRYVSLPKDWRLPHQYSIYLDESGKKVAEGFFESEKHFRHGDRSFFLVQDSVGLHRISSQGKKLVLEKKKLIRIKEKHFSEETFFLSIFQIDQKLVFQSDFMPDGCVTLHNGKYTHHAIQIPNNQFLEGDLTDSGAGDKLYIAMDIVGNKFGFVDANLAWKIEAKYSAVSCFFDGLARVREKNDDSSLTFISTDGKVKFSTAEFETFGFWGSTLGKAANSNSCFNSSRCIGRKGRNTAVLDKNVKVVFSADSLNVRAILPFSNDVAFFISKNNQLGITDRNGSIVKAAEFTQLLRNFNGGAAFVKKDAKRLLIDGAGNVPRNFGKETISLEPQSGFWTFAKPTKVGLLDGRGLQKFEVSASELWETLLKE